jgi:RNA polymerase sigma-70 factor (ECF subfamily)
MRHPSKILERLFRNHHRALTNRATRLIGSQEAEDIVQDAYLKMLQKRDWEDVANAKSYLSKTASNIAIDWLRRQKARSKSMADDVELEQLTEGGLAFAAISIESDLVCEMRMILGQLPPDCLKIFLLSRILGHSHAEVARETGISIRTVHRCINRALNHLDPDFSAETKEAVAEQRWANRSVSGRKKKSGRACPISTTAIVLTNGSRIFAEPRPLEIGQLHARRDDMKIRIAKRVALNVIGRASARCASTCAVTNG